MKNRYRFRLEDFVDVPCPTDIRRLESTDIHALAKLMIEAYRGTPDYEGETVEETVALLGQALSGDPNPLTGEGYLPDCSYVLERDGVVLGACILTLWKDAPLISTIFTHPEYKGQGIAGQVLSACMTALKGCAYDAVFAFITQGNTASERLFTRLGFEEAPRQT